MDNKKRILVVDDDLNIDFLQTKLQMKGFEVDICRDGMEASEQILANQYNIVITDINMPRRNGFGFVEFIKEKNINVPVIMMSGNATSENAVRANSLGVIALLVKPINWDKFDDAITNALVKGHPD